MFTLKTDLTERVLVDSTLEQCIDELKYFYKCCDGSCTIYREGIIYAKVSKCNTYQGAITLLLS